MRLCALSVDLDELPNYHAIHGLSPPEGAAAHLVYDVALRRLRDFAATAEVPLTLFAIGRDLARSASARALADLASRGHEVGNHTLDHRYDLTRLAPDEQRRQIEGGAAAIEAATGRRPTGFRAPGYTVTDGLYDVLEELGVGYGSSVFPCPAYYLAKAAALGVIRARGRSSHSVLDDPRVLLAPTRPYRVGRPYQRRGQGLLELPVQVTRGPRLPFIGTTLTLLGARGARLLTRMVVGEPLVNLELHGIDVLDADDGFPELRQHQPDARVPHVQKLLALGAVVDELRRAGYAFVRLDEAARAFG